MFPLTPTEEATMAARYEFRRDFTDGTFDTVRIDGTPSIADADRVARETGDVEATTLLAIVDLEPVRPLVVFA